MLPYGITGIYPNMGPIGQSTNIMVTGKGFDNDLRENGRCKFGTEDHYIIVEANVLEIVHLPRVPKLLERILEVDILDGASIHYLRDCRT